MSVRHDILSVLHRRGEGYEAATLIRHLFADVISSQIDLLVIDGIIFNEPIGLRIKPLAFIFTVGADPFHVVVFHSSVTIFSSFLSPFEHLD